MDTTKRYYLAGPMSGVAYHNFPLFEKVAEGLRADGYDVVSPAELDNNDLYEAAMNDPTGDIDKCDWTWGDFLARDVKIVADQVDGIICLPGWEKSRGACLETFVARLCGKPVYRLMGKDQVEELSLEELNRAHYRVQLGEANENS